MENSVVLISYITLFFTAFVGSFFNDYYNTLMGQEERILAGRIIIGAITGFLVTVILLDYLPDNRPIAFLSIPKMDFLIVFISGIGGFQFFPVLQSLKLVKIIEIYTGLKTEKFRERSNTLKSHSEDNETLQEEE